MNFYACQPESDTVAVTTLHHFNTLNHVEPEPSTEDPERINTSPSILEGNTIKITGTLHVDAGFLRLKPNINFIGAKLGISVYDLSKPKPLEIELNPTPAEGLYLVDHVLDPNSEFLPSEHWHIPNDDCTFDELRGIKQITSDTIKALETQVAVLGLENTSLKQQILEVSLENAKLTQITIKEESVNNKANISLDILKRLS